MFSFCHSFPETCKVNFSNPDNLKSFTVTIRPGICRCVQHIVWYTCTFNVTYISGLLALMLHTCKTIVQCPPLNGGLKVVHICDLLFHGKRRLWGRQYMYMLHVMSTCAQYVLYMCIHVGRARTHWPSSWGWMPILSCMSTSTCCALWVQCIRPEFP